jgi:hypothetical protein
MRSLVKADGGEDRNVVRQRVRSSNVWRGMPITPLCDPTCFCVSS